MKSTSPRVSVFLFSTLQTCPHILKMCMKNYNDEKIFFDKFLQQFLT